MDSASTKFIGTLLERMVASDTDYRFMAMNDLINELRGDSLRLDSQSEKKVVSLVLRLLKDPNGEVQSLAVKSLGPLSTKVKTPQVLTIIKELLSNVHEGGDEQLRGISTIGLKTVMSALPAVSDTSVLQAVIGESLNSLLGMVASHSDENVRVEACEVLVEMITHFGGHLSDSFSELLKCMLLSLNSPQHTLRKRTTQALGCLAWSVPPKYFAALIAYLLFRLSHSMLFLRPGTVIPDDQITVILAEHPVLQQSHVTEHLRQITSVDIVKTCLQCLNLVSRHLVRLPNYLHSVLQLLSQILRQSKTDDSDYDEIHELAIQTLETLIRCCPRAITSSLTDLIGLLYERLQYDPNYDYSVPEENGDSMAVDNTDGEFDEDLDEEEDEYTDDEDLSWKVRRAAARSLEAIILIFPEKTSVFYDSIAPFLIKRFHDHEEPVRLSVFSCFAALLRQTRITPSASSGASFVNRTADTLSSRSHDGFPLLTSTPGSIPPCCFTELHAQLKDPESPQSKLQALLPTICPAIQKQASLSAKRKSHTSSLVARGIPGTQHAAFMLYRELAMALPGQLGGEISEIFSLIQAYSRDSSASNTVKMDMVNLVVLLVSSHSSECFQSTLELVVQLAVWAMNDSFYRVALEGLELTQLLCTMLKRLGQEHYARALFPPLSALLEATDRDLELKEKAIATMAIFISYLGDTVVSELDRCLTTICRRLKNELTRLAAVRAIHIVSVSALPLKLDMFLPGASDELATFLSLNDRILRLATLRCLYTIWSKHPEIIGPTCLETTLSLLPKLLTSEQDLQTAQLVIQLVSLLLESAGPLITKFITSDAFVQPLIGLAHSPLLRGHALEAMLRLMRAIGRRSQSRTDHGLITFFLSQLLNPLNGSGLLGRPKMSHQGTPPLHRDALASLAQCVTELLAELPVTSSTPIETPASVNEGVDRLIAAVLDPTAPPTETYLNLLILGELGRKLDLSNRTDLREIFISCLSARTLPHSDGTPTLTITEEVKPAAALGLGRLVAGQPETLIPFLVERISEIVTGSDPSAAVNGVRYHHQLYHMLQALREALVNMAVANVNNALKTHLDALWSLLIASSGMPEEGTRSVVAECLGRLILVSPRQLISRLRQQLNSPEASASPLIRCTLITAIKSVLIVTDLDSNFYAQAAGQTRMENLDWPCGLPISPCVLARQDSSDAHTNTLTEVDAVLRSAQPISPLLDFLSRLADPDLLVRRAALITLNTSAHHRSSLIRPLLNVPLELNATGQSSCTLLKLLYAETAVKPELIREVEMGPFKHKEDDGLDTRKCAFECMFTLLETCLDKLMMAEFLEPLIEGLKDHTDIKLLSYQMLRQIVRIRPLEISTKMEAIAAPIKTVLLAKPKEDWVKQEMEKMQELSRSAVAVVASFKLIEDIDKNRYYVDLVRTVEADPNLKALYSSALSESSSSTNFYQPSKRVPSHSGFAYRFAQ